MLDQLHNFPRNKHFYLAISGGSDSMAVADFYLRGNKNFSLAYFNHQTPQADAMGSFVSSWAKKNNVALEIGKLSENKDSKKSKEEHWRDERYKFFADIGSKNSSPIVTAHHLDDAVEWWIMSCLHGEGKLILDNKIIYHQGKEKKYGVIVYRPFLTNTKKQLTEWCTRHNIAWLEDESNKDVTCSRNRVRHNIIPECLKVNPGIHKVIKKKLIERNYHASQKS